MADLTLTPAPLLGTIPDIGANRIRERDDLAIVSVATPQGGRDTLAAALEAAFGLEMPGPMASTATGEMRAIATTPDQMLLVFPHATPDASPFVQGKLAGAGYTTDQTDAWVILDIAGPETLAALERLCPLDIAGLGIGDAARTGMEHMGAVILRLGEAEFRLMSASSSAGSFLHAVEVSYRNVV